MDDFPLVAPQVTPTANRPLLGMTILIVEDSLYACEALRLMGIRSGARIRRADCLRSARRHLRLYRPSCAIIDMGLPDGSGADLIAEVTRTSPRISVILGTSGDDLAHDATLKAGADGFLSKPLNSLAAFQEAILSRLPADQCPKGPRTLNDIEIFPDTLALKDDFIHASEVLADAPDTHTLQYACQFVQGLARSTQDRSLQDASTVLKCRLDEGAGHSTAVLHLQKTLSERLVMQAVI